MSEVITSIQILKDYLKNKPEIDRIHVVAHATLSAWTSHWPMQCSPLETRLINDSIQIKEVEMSRWLKQRRMALSKLARAINQT